MKYIIFSDPVTGWVGEPIALLESNEERLRELHASGFDHKVMSVTVPQTQYRRAGGKSKGYAPVRS